MCVTLHDASLGQTTIAGWRWDPESQRWVVQRGHVLITARFPYSEPPPVPADIFGVQLLAVPQQEPEQEPGS